MTSQLDTAIRSPAATAVRAETKDWAGAWFEILDEMGEYVGMRAGRRASEAAEPAWQFCSHTSYDGLGWFATSFRQQQARHIDSHPAHD